MRPLYIVAGVVARIGLAGWATLGQAQTGPKPLPPGGRPSRVEFSSPQPKPRPDDDLFDKLPDPPKPLPKDVESIQKPVRSSDPIDLPDVSVPKLNSPLKPTTEKIPSRGDVKPTVFIPNSDPPEAAKGNGPAAKQEPSISLEWHGPADLRVGVPCEYTMVAKNTSSVPMYKVIVQVKFPAGSKVAGTEPKAEGSDLVLLWDHGTIAPRQERAVKINIVPPGKGELLCQAWVTFTGSATLKAQVREPKLAVEAKVPERVSVGDPARSSFRSATSATTRRGRETRDQPAAGSGSEAGTPDGVDFRTLAAGNTRRETRPSPASPACRFARRTWKAAAD